MKRLLNPALASLMLWLCGAIGLARPARAADAYQVVSDPDNSLAFLVAHNGGTLLKMDAGAWAPNWAWVAVNSKDHPAGALDVSTVITFNAQRNETATLHLHAAATGPQTVVMEYSVKAAKDFPVQLIAATIGVPEGGSAHAVLNLANGAPEAVQLPAPPSWHGGVKSMELTSNSGEKINVAVDPPMDVGVDGVLRVVLVSDLLKAGEKKAALTWTFPAAVTLATKPGDLAKLAPEVVTPDWFAFQPKWNLNDGPLSMASWQNKPAGSREGGGAVVMKGDHFELADGTPIKFWGVDLSYANSAPEKLDADFTAARYQKYGINAVRMHKFTGSGWEGIGDENDATRMTAAGLAKLDYFSNELRQRGIYYGWSHTYHFKIRPQNKAQVAGYDELMKAGGDTYGVINWAEDVQDLLIAQVVNLLKHKNPYSQTTYADDPALAFIEFQNEDDIFFYTSTDAYNKFPTYKKLLQKRFAQWLTAKYGTAAKLTAAWGALNRGESLEQSTIEIQPNPWFESDQNLPNQQGTQRQRLLDNAAFLFDTQNNFYTKFTTAIRAAGYKGPLIGSPWQAPTMLPHYYNLRADSLAGYIDRHDYFGGALNDTMLKNPGGGYLSAGLQQVAGLPFGLSEWIHVYPSLYSAEGPVIIAAYGMGLQGWDASYEFQSTSARPNVTKDIVGNLPFGVWNADVPTQIGQYPILSRMVQRGDVKEGAVIATRRISPENLAAGQFDFADSLQQKLDVKTFAAPELLAAGRAVVEFTDKSTPSTIPNPSTYKQSSVIKSNTGQLAWDAGAGVITIDTPGTQGFVGFARDKSITLGDMTITSHSPYASLLLTAREPTETLATAKHVLISAMARNANTGFRILTLDGKTITDNGRPPIMLEPILADITLKNRHITKIEILDHDGQPTTRTLTPTSPTAFTLDTKKDKAIYYQLTLE